MSIVDVNDLVLALKGFKKRLEVSVYDDDGNATDASQLDLQVQTLGGEVLYEDSWTTPPPGGTRIVHPATGRYFITWGDPDREEVATTGKLLFIWAVVGHPGTEEVQRPQTLEVITPAVADCIREFRQLIDKSRKAVSVDPEAFCPLGYTDGMLLQYLRGGLSLINAYQPYPTFSTLDSFPSLFIQVLFDAALLVGVNAQTLFAVDSDIENYSDQGNAFVINHQPKLAAFAATLTAALTERVPPMKRHLVRSGSAKIEAGPNMRLATLLQMSPTGATFRNVYTR